MEEFTHTLLENGSIEQKNNQYVLNRNDPAGFLCMRFLPDRGGGIVHDSIHFLEPRIKGFEVFYF